MAVDYESLWADTWGDMQSHGPVHRHTQRMLAETVGHLGVRSILDVGCGGGDNLATLQREGRYELTGIDVSVAALRRASQRVAQGELACPGRSDIPAPRQL